MPWPKSKKNNRWRDLTYVHTNDQLLKLRGRTCSHTFSRPESGEICEIMFYPLNLISIRMASFPRNSIFYKTGVLFYDVMNMAWMPPTGVFHRNYCTFFGHITAHSHHISMKIYLLLAEQKGRRQWANPIF